MQVRRGNINGIITILLYSSLAILSIFTASIPAFELTSMAFFVASNYLKFLLKLGLLE